MKNISLDQLLTQLTSDECSEFTWNIDNGLCGHILTFFNTINQAIFLKFFCKLSNPYLCFLDLLIVRDYIPNTFLQELAYKYPEKCFGLILTTTRILENIRNIPRLSKFYTNFLIYLGEWKPHLANNNTVIKKLQHIIINYTLTNL
jgi:hypothetical protein